MRTMNEANAIIDWMAAMKAVHDMLIEVLGNKELLGEFVGRNYLRNYISPQLRRTECRKH